MKLPLIQKPKKYDKSRLLYHNYRFGFIGNIRVLFCRLFGHRVSENPKYNNCSRCGLCYEEIYHDVGEGWFMESGIVSKENILDKFSKEELRELTKDIT